MPAHQLQADRTPRHVLGRIEQARYDPFFFNHSIIKVAIICPGYEPIREI